MLDGPVARAKATMMKLSNAGLPCPVISGGGTGTFPFELEGGVRQRRHYFGNFGNFGSLTAHISHATARYITLHARWDILNLLHLSLVPVLAGCLIATCDPMLWPIRTL